MKRDFWHWLNWFLLPSFLFPFLCVSQCRFANLNESGCYGGLCRLCCIEKILDSFQWRQKSSFQFMKKVEISFTQIWSQLTKQYWLLSEWIKPNCERQREWKEGGKREHRRACTHTLTHTHTHALSFPFSIGSAWNKECVEQWCFQNY